MRIFLLGSGVQGPLPEAPLWGFVSIRSELIRSCINVLAPPWGICDSLFKKETNAWEGGGGRCARLELTEQHVQDGKPVEEAARGVRARG